jgi:ATP-dependent Lon protease
LCCRVHPTEVIVPERNATDLDDVPSDVRQQMTFHIVRSVDEVLALAPRRSTSQMAV